MKRIIAALAATLALALSASATAQSYVDASEMSWEFKDENGFVILSNKPCTNAVILDHIKEEFHADFRAGEVGVTGKPSLPLCYDAEDMRDGTVTIIGVNGRAFKADMTRFVLRSGT